MDISWCLNFYHSLYIKPHSVLGVPTKVAFLVHILFYFMRIWFFKQWRFLECICMPLATKFLFHAILFFCSDCGVFSMKNFVPQFHSQYSITLVGKVHNWSHFRSQRLAPTNFTTSFTLIWTLHNWSHFSSQWPAPTNLALGQ
jgi:hypothetical protein